MKPIMVLVTIFDLKSELPSSQERNCQSQPSSWCRSTLTRQPSTTSRRTRRSRLRPSWVLLEAPWDFSQDSPSSAASRSSSFSSGWFYHKFYLAQTKEIRFKLGIRTNPHSLKNHSSIMGRRRPFHFSGWSPPWGSGELMLWKVLESFDVKKERIIWCKKSFRNSM